MEIESRLERTWGRAEGRVGTDYLTGCFQKDDKKALELERGGCCTTLYIH